MAYQERYEFKLIGLRSSEDCSDHSRDDDARNTVKEEMSEPHSSRIGDTIGELHGLDGRPTFFAYVEGKECREYGLHGS